MSKVINPYWFGGKVLQPGNIDLHRIYIQHLPKTGTTTLFGALKCAFDAQFALISEAAPNFVPPKSWRFDNPEYLKLGDAQINDSFALVASHLPYGFHRKFAHQFKIVTIVREPFKRVLSAYTYGCMRSQKLPSREGFETFFRSEENINVMAKLISGLSETEQATNETANKAIENLKSDFYIYGTTQHIQLITSHLLKLNLLPNVLCDHLNKTEDEYTIDGEPFADEIRELNQHDVNLYRFVEESPRIIFDDANDTSPPHQKTVLIREVSNTDKSRQVVAVAETNDIISLIQDNRCDKKTFDKIIK